MSLREIDRLKVIQAVLERNLKPMQAAKKLGLTTRQVRRLVSRYRDGAINSRYPPMPSNRRPSQPPTST